MDFDAHVKVELDTKKAKSQARDLARSRVRSKKKQTEVANRRSPISGKLSKLVGGVAGFSAVNRMMHGGGGQASPWDAWRRPTEALAQKYLDEAIGYSARARATALGRTFQKAAFASRPGQSLAPARAFFKTDLSIQNEVEAGRNILRADPRFAGVDFMDLIKQSLGGYFDLLYKSFGYMGEAFGK